MSQISTESSVVKEPIKFNQTQFGKNLPGVILVLIIAYLAYSVGKQIPLIGGTVVAILLGMFLRNFFGVPALFEAGISYSLKKILRYAIILLGVSLNLWQVLTIGAQSLIGIVAVVTLGILLTLYIGRLMKLSGDTPLLIGVGTAICGATAIATVSPVLKSKDEETALAITTIFIFNVLAVIIYPLLGVAFQMSNEIFGMWAGLAIHDTSSVVAAGYMYSNEAGGVATVVKLTRTLFLVPLVLIIGIYISMKLKKEAGATEGANVKISKIFPWFLLGFLGMSILNTIGIFSAGFVETATDISKFMILMAMVGVGFGANFKKIKEIGLKPIYVGLIASVIVAVISIILIYLVV